jgi:hypothetical protein
MAKMKVTRARRGRKSGCEGRLMGFSTDPSHRMSREKCG